MKFVWVVFLCSLSCVLTQRKEENDPCNLSTGEEGVCKLVSVCPSAQNLLKTGKTPDHCGFSVYEPIVCCLIEDRKNSSNVVNTVLIKNPTNETLEDEAVGALSRNKCIFFHPKPKYPMFIAGGKPSLSKEFPHMAVIGFGEEDNIQWMCGGSLISYNFVLTAAHCLESREWGPAKWIRLGDLDLKTDEDDTQPQNFTIKTRIPHPLYKPPARYHDIALIELDRKASPSVYVSPACLHTERDLKETRMTATGWGRTSFSDESNNLLMKVDMDYISNDKCTETFGDVLRSNLPNGIVDDWQICAGGVIGKDTCQGDSGGPLQVKNRERTFGVRVHTIIGITSFGKVCALSRAPGIYTRISNYIPWIESVVWPNEDAATVLKPMWRPLN